MKNVGLHFPITETNTEGITVHIFKLTSIHGTQSTIQRHSRLTTLFLPLPSSKSIIFLRFCNCSILHKFVYDAFLLLWLDFAYFTSKSINEPSNRIECFLLLFTSPLTHYCSFCADRRVCILFCCLLFLYQITFNVFVCVCFVFSTYD